VIATPTVDEDDRWSGGHRRTSLDMSKAYAVAVQETRRKAIQQSNLPYVNSMRQASLYF
jgi:hypothetical protein